MKILNKIRKGIIIFMFAVSSEDPGVPKRIKLIYNKPESISKLVDYWKGFLTTATDDDRFHDYEEMLASCKTEVDKLDLCEQKAVAKDKGAAAARNVQYFKTEVQMDKPLAILQSAVDADATIAAELIKLYNLKIDSRGGRSSTEEEVTNGEKPGTILVKNKYVNSTTCYLRMISTDKENWYVGDFGKKCKGIISEMNGQPLTSGQRYYVKTMTDDKNGKHPYGQIFEIYCL